MILAAVPEWMSGTWSCLIASEPVAEYYASHLRDNLFNGCLTLGGFLLAAYTFIVIHMKTSVYDSPDYHRNFEEKRKADSRLRRYDPLRNMSRRLFRTVCVTLIAGFVQLTIGLWKQNIAAVVCVLFGFWAVYEVGVALCVMGRNLREWLNMLEDAPIEVEPKSEGAP